MTRVLVTGGTGTLGRALVPALRERGFDVRVLSRRAESEQGRVVGDLSSAAGLDRALDGVDLVVHAATANGREDIRQTRNLLAAMHPGQRILAVSIVGIDRIPLPYYQAKLEVERLIRSSTVPWTIARFTQFHDLVARIFEAQRRSPVLFAPDFDVQPIDVRNVAEQLAALAADPPEGFAPDSGGPAVRAFKELAVAWQSEREARRRVLPVRLPGKTFAGYRSGAHTVPDGAIGRIGFEEFLRAR